MDYIGQMKSAIWFLCVLSGYMWISIPACNGDDVGLSQPVAGDYIPLTCWNFSVGDWQHREFYSPQYPEDYSNSTECMQRIIAPKGYRIRLDFRDEFHIEYSDGCKYDFLELRDGPFGYSQLLGRYCGKEHPPITESTSRFLWIRFKSDDSIEYKGFRAVFEFFKPDSGGGGGVGGGSSAGEIGTNPSSNAHNMCRIEVPIVNGEGLVDSNEIVDNHQVHNDSDDDITMIDCTYVIYAPAKHRVYLRWPEYQMSTPQNCADSFLELYERTTALSDRRKQLCGGIARDFRSTSNHVYIRVFAQTANLIPLFKALLTIYTPGPCPADKFDCGDDTCIERDLVCDGEVNCNYSWDEMNCEDETGAVQPTSTSKPIILTYHTIILSCVGGGIALIIILSICITCHQRKREEKRRCHALKQDERRAVEMTTLINHKGAPAGGGGTPVHMERAGGIGVKGATLQNHQMRNGHKNKGNGIVNNTHHTGGGDYYSDGGTDTEGTYRRYLEVNRYPEEAEYLQTAAGVGHGGMKQTTLSRVNHTQIPAIVTIEKPPRANGNGTPGHGTPGHEWQRDQQTPSPRPDVVQEEKFLYPPPDESTAGLRRLSIDTVKSDKSDIWKPMEPRSQMYKTLDHKTNNATSERPVQNTERRTLPRVNFNLDNLEHKPRGWEDTRMAGTLPHNSNSKYSTYPHPPGPHATGPHSQGPHASGPQYSEDPYINRTVYLPPPPAGASPQSTVYHNRPSASNTLPSGYSSANNSPQLRQAPPKPPQRSPHTELQSGGKQSPVPDMFYTRPNKRTVPNPQAKHANV